MTPIGIVAHKSRESRALRLADTIDAEFLSIDSGSPRSALGPGRNHDQVWEWLNDSPGEWKVVLEDDALPVKGFRNQLTAVLKAAPTPIVSLYLGRGRPPHWQPSIARVIADPRTDPNFLVGTELLHHVAVAMKADLVSDMLAKRDRTLPIDESIGEWARRAGHAISYSRPSIVDHDFRLDTTILRHISRHKTDNGRRDNPRELRKAWAFGARQQWNDSWKVIPEPNL